MTKRNLFDIFLKVLGIFFIKDTFLLLPQLLSLITLLSRADRTDDIITTLSMSLLLLLIYIFIGYCLIFQTELVINKLKLDKGSEDQTIQFQLHRSTILSISILVIGGYLLSQEIPNFCRQLFTYFEERKLKYVERNPSTPYLVLSGIKILIGLVLLGNQRLSVNFIELKRKN